MRRKGIFAFAIAVANSGGLGACDSHGVPEGIDEVVVSCDAAAAGAGFASDESWVKFVEAASAGKVVLDDCKAPALVSPAPGTTLDRTVAPTFTFTPTQPACAVAFAPVRRSAAACRWERPRRSGWLRALSPIGVAEAHCPSVNGPNYLFQIKTAGETTPFYRALLSVDSFTPNLAIWRKATAARAGQSVEITIQRAAFSNGGITEGPFSQKQPFMLTLAH